MKRLRKSTNNGGKSKKNGMTLMEILIVISLLALLVGVLVRSLAKSAESAKKASAKLFCETTSKIAIEAYKLTHNGRLPVRWDQLKNQLDGSILDPWGNPYELKPIPNAERPQCVVVYSTFGKTENTPEWGDDYETAHKKIEEENALCKVCVGAVIK